MQKLIEVILGDITLIPADVIVNSTNSSLYPGTGLDAIIHKKAGVELSERCQSLGGCDVGSAKITSGYRLSANWIIHAVGPKYPQPNHEKLLQNCYKEILLLAKNVGAKTISLPAISTGVYGYPKNKASEIAIETILNFCKENKCFSKINIVVSDELNFTSYQKRLRSS